MKRRDTEQKEDEEERRSQKRTGTEDSLDSG
jgi:hypothetical protein